MAQDPLAQELMTNDLYLHFHTLNSSRSQKTQLTRKMYMYIYIHVPLSQFRLQIFLGDERKNPIIECFEHLVMILI